VKAHRQTKRARQPIVRAFLRSVVMLALTASILVILPMRCTGQEGPKPDPAGIATGDKTTVLDAGGNAFVVTEPTDKTAPDYAQKKKDFDEFQAQAAKEPLAVKLADAAGHIRVATNWADIYAVYATLEQGEAAKQWSFEEGHCGHRLRH
jgi:hypothetical protein